MSSSTHTQGIGFRPLAFAGRSDVLSLIQQQQQVAADNRYAVYVANAGNGIHLVQNQCNDQPYPVTSALPGVSFAPGAQVILSSNAGQPGEVIIGVAPLGRGGSSAFPSLAVTVTVHHSTIREVTGMCPTPIRARQYLAIHTPGSGVIQLDRYADGHYVGAIATLEPGGDFSGPFSWQLSGSHTLVCGIQGAVERNSIGTWDFQAGTFKVAHAAFGGVVGGPLVLAGFVYFSESTNPGGTQSFLQMRRIPVGFEGEIDLDATKWGPLYNPVGLEAPADSLGIYKDGTIDCSSTIGGEDAIPYLLGGVWHAGTDRHKINPGPGFALSLPASATVSIKNGGNGPVATEKEGDETILIPPDWWASGSMSGALCYPSPSGNEIACYPCASISEGGAPTLVRLKLQATERTGCTQPKLDLEPGTGGQYPDVMIPTDF